MKVFTKRGDNQRYNTQEVFKKAVKENKFNLLDTNLILIKPNLNHHLRFPECTHVDAVRGLLDQIRTLTTTPVVIAESSYTSTVAAFRLHGYENLTEEYPSVQLVDLNQDFSVMDQVDFCISISPINPHDEMDVSASILNWAFGTWKVPANHGSLGKTWPRMIHLENEKPEVTHGAVVRLYQKKMPKLSVIDSKQSAFASADPVALDAYACQDLGLNPAQISYLNLAEQQGIGKLQAEVVEL